MNKRIIVICSLLVAHAFGNCRIDDDLMLSILLNEKHSVKNPGYEYLISFNNPEEAKSLRVNYKELFLDERTLDCKNLDSCVNLLNNLINQGVINIDLGAYQLNYKHQRLNNHGDYFRIEPSYYKACGYVEQMVSEVGYTWRGIAAYHSKTEKYNKIYRRNLISTYKNILSRKK
ncbi:MAG: hypothetical protein PHS42_04955 [Sulfurimonas sp.]|nr:hypothetical protein [Sulfurimonas sp.]